jgi:tagatose-6-phosphate ketose/aldose isomerase
MILNYPEQELEQLGAFHTATEIVQQPFVWKKTLEKLSSLQDEIERLLQDINSKFDTVRVILTGAGTSAYVGDTVLPYLLQQNRYEHFHYESIATTDLVVSPHIYFQKETPTLLVSFARSGNSPESLAAVQLAEQFIDPLYQLVITCNAEGQLALNTKGNPQNLVLYMPEETNDKGFAMTSSFTSMLLSVGFVFSNKDDYKASIGKITDVGEYFLQTALSTIESVCTANFNRIVYLGSGVFTGLARESALKMLELSSGKTVALCESTLGFRHGPKSVLDDESVVVMFISNDPYTRKYDIDMLKEIYQEDLNVPVIAVAQNPSEEIINHSHFVVNIPVSDMVEDIFLSFLYVTFAQSLALKKSIDLGINPDNPSPSGMVNRVVQGVAIYPY